MYIDSITRKVFKYATPIFCDNNRQNFKALDPDTNEHYGLTLKHVIRATPMLFEQKQVQSAKSPNTFTAKEAGIYSTAELTISWCRALFTKHSDTTLKFWGKAIWYGVLATSEQHSTEFYSTNNRNRFITNNVYRVGLHDHILNIAPLFALDRFADAFNAVFGFPRFILTHYGRYFSTFLFLQVILAFQLKFFTSISVTYRLHENITPEIISPMDFFVYTATKMVIGLKNAEGDKSQRKIFQRHEEPPEYSSKINSWKIQKNSVK